MNDLKNLENYRIKIEMKPVEDQWDYHETWILGIWKTQANILFGILS